MLRLKKSWHNNIFLSGVKGILLSIFFLLSFSSNHGRMNMDNCYTRKSLKQKDRALWLYVLCSYFWFATLLNVFGGWSITLLKLKKVMQMMFSPVSLFFPRLLIQALMSSFIAFLEKSFGKIFSVFFAEFCLTTKKSNRISLLQKTLPPSPSSI